MAVLRAACGLPPAADTAGRVAARRSSRARSVDLEIARAALRWHAQHYATPTAPHRASCATSACSPCPSSTTASQIDGTLTVQTLVKRGPLDPMQAARLLWALASLGAIDVHARGPRRRDAGAPRARRDPRAPARAHGAPRAQHVLRRPRDHAARRVQRDRGRVSARRPALSRRTVLGALRPRRARRGGVAADVGPRREGAQRARRSRGARPLPRLAAPEPARAAHGVGDRSAEAAQPRAEAFARGQRSLGEGDVAPRDERPRDRVPPSPRPPRLRGEPRVGAVSRPGRVGAAISVEAAVAERRSRRGSAARLPAVAARARRARAAVRGRRRCRLRALAPRSRAVRSIRTCPAAAQLAQRLGMRR